MRKTEDKITMDSAKITSFEDFENFYAVEVVREAKKADSQMVLCMDCNHDCINFFKRCMDVY